MQRRKYESLEDFNIRNRKSRMDYYYNNKELEKSKSKKYMNTFKGKESHLRTVKKFRENNPEKYKAYSIVSYSIKKGFLKRDVCFFCGNPNVHAHHNDYSKPLEVIWVCPQHHKDIHLDKIGV